MRVPVYDNLQTGIAPTNGAQVRNQDVGAIGEIGARQAAQMGQVLGNAGDALGQIALQRQALVNEADVKQADIAASAAVRDLLRNPQTGFLNQTGAAAVKARDDVARQIDDIYQKAGEGLGNDITRGMWSDVSTRRRDDAFSQIDDHANREEYVYAIQSSDDRRQNETDGLIHSLNDKKAYDAHLATIRVESAHSAALQRMDPALKLKKDLAQAHMAVIRDRIAAGEPTVAQTYYDSHKDEISESDRAAFEAPLKQAVSASLALSNADEAFALFAPNTPYGIHDRSAIDAWARNRYGEDVAGLAVFRQESDRRYQDLLISRQLQLSSAQNALYTEIQNKGLTRVRQSQEWLDLPEATRLEVIGHSDAAHTVRTGLASRDPDTRRTTEKQVMAEAGNLDDTALAHMSQGELQLRFGALPEVHAYVRRRQADLGKQPPISKAGVDALLASVGIFPTGGSKADQAAAGFARFQLDTALLGEIARRRGSIPPDEALDFLRHNLWAALDGANNTADIVCRQRDRRAPRTNAPIRTFPRIGH